MIIKQLINFWRGDSNLKEIFNEFDEMLMIAKEMFEKSSRNLFNEQENIEHEIRELIKHDGKLNALQQSIRRDIVMHISVKGETDVLPCLILMSLVKDAERLGDYAKNIMEIGEKFHDFEKGKYFDRLREMQSEITGWFDETKEAFHNIDQDHAQKITETAYKLEKECDKYAWELMNDRNKPDAVALALVFRFFKRTAAHLGNICSSVTMPLDKLDYFEK